MGPVLRKELGEQLVAAGLVGAAMTLFEELELWDALILCYRLLQKNVQAEELVHKRLEVSYTDALHAAERIPLRHLWHASSCHSICWSFPAQVHFLQVLRHL